VVPYAEARLLQQAVATRSDDDYLLVLEHPHVFTLGVRADPAHVLTDPATVGATLERTDRGGDVTYHGPGQLVVYPIVDVDVGPGGAPAHVRRVEDVVIGALCDLGLDRLAGGVGRLAGYPGVWVGVDGPQPRKVAAVGVRTVRTDPGRRRSLHGVAINVDCDLAMFGHIVPCGIPDRPVTSLLAEGLAVPIDAVAEAVIARAVAAWSTPRTDESQRATSPSAPVVPAPAAAPPPPDRAPVALGPTRSPGRPGDPDEPAAYRRLRRAGVDPDAGVPIGDRKPPWLRVPATMGAGYLALGRTVHDLGLATVCEEAGCPNIYECWSDGTATFMINGSRCTRACGFCLVDTRRPLPLDPSEPERVAEAVERMGLGHAVITCVARDDLPDGGASAMAATVAAIRARRPSTTVEVLISDCKGDEDALAMIFDARPDVLNHNLETVLRLQRAVRPSAAYARSLGVLARAADRGLVVKSGLMVGLGETEPEVRGALADLRAVGVSIVTIGQYLRPSRDHLPVARWWTPAELDRLGAEGLALGLRHVEASPLTRSSYHARQAAASAGAVPSPV
jgi:lipoic acid synthetase